MQMRQMPKRPVEWYESPDLPEKLRIDPVARVFRLVVIFTSLQALTFLGVIWLVFR